MGCGASTKPAAYSASSDAPPEAQPWREPQPTDRVAVFVAYHHQEALDEAAYLQAELSKTLGGKRVMLDSDRPAAGRSLVDHVREAEAVVLLQTAGVLTQAQVLVELVAAVDAGIAIFGVALKGGPPAYSFDASVELLTHLDSLLEPIAPGSIAVLRDQGVNPTDASHKLANTVPKTISRPLNMAASPKVLSATISDLTATINKTAGATRPALPEQSRWLAQREPPPPPASLRASLLVAQMPSRLRKVNTGGEGMGGTKQLLTSVAPAADRISSKRTFAAFLSHAKAEVEDRQKPVPSVPP